MTKAIEEDHQYFRRIIEGKTRRELKRLIDTGHNIRLRDKGGKIAITIPQIHLPRLMHGDSDGEVGRGKGNKGDIIYREPKKSKDGKGGAGEGHSEGITILIDFDEFLDFMGEELKLPRIKPKPNEVYEEIRIKYNDISKQGPESLRHNRKTFLNALLRQAACGDLDTLVQAPGTSVPIKMINVIEDDKRYRQYKEVKIPTSNAVIFFARDSSGSMDDARCDIVSDLAWWLEKWIGRSYDNLHTRYYIHDWEAEEVGQNKFYNYRFGGGTKVSSVFDMMAEDIKYKYPPDKWNIYIFYFTDGDNMHSDNQDVEKLLSTKFTEDIVNMVGYVEIYPFMASSSLGSYLNKCIKDGKFKSNFLKVEALNTQDSFKPSEEDKNKRIMDILRRLLSDSN